VLGLVAGEGKLPAILARNAKAQAYKVTGLALSVQSAAILRVALLALSIASLSYFLYRTLKLRRS
jgi:DUF1009 family protein